MSPGSSKPPAPGSRRGSAPPVIPNLYEEEGTGTDQTAIISPKSTPSTRRPVLVVMAGAGLGRVFRIDKARMTIGRHKVADLVLNDQGISREHCAIVRTGARYFIEDLESTNGTIVNGGLTTRVELTAGDRIQLGPDAMLQFGFYDEAEEGLANMLYEAATRDPLTQAFNRRHFQERLSAEISFAARHSTKLVAVVLDIDHFKSVNDSYGHPTGDAALRDVASAIKETLRGEDVFARYGGEEFVVLARGLSLRHGVKLGERIRKLIESRIVLHGVHRFRVTVSIGIAELSEVPVDVTGEAFIKLADARLYKAKQQGRNRVVAK